MEAMSQSLRLTQFLRLLKSGDVRVLGHIGFWMGGLLEDFVQQFRGLLSEEIIPSFFVTLYDLVNQAVEEEYLTAGNWRSLTNKMVYNEHVKKFGVVKIERESGLCFKKVWERLNCPILSRGAVEHLYMLVHNKIPVKERYF